MSNPAILICDPWYYKEKLLILDIRCWIHLDTMDFGDVIKEINKAFEQLICFYNNKIVRRDFTNILNLFHVFL